MQKPRNTNPFPLSTTFTSNPKSPEPLKIQPRFIPMEIESQFITHEIEQDDQSYSGCGSDRKSTVTGSGIGVSFSDGIRVVRLDEEDGVYQGLRKRFFSLLGRDLGSGGVEVVAIHRKIWEAGDGDGGDGRLGKFLIRCNEVKRRDNKRVDLRRAWFGGSKDGIEKIVSRGLGDSEIMESNSSDNVDGVRLFAEEFLGERLCIPVRRKLFPTLRGLIQGWTTFNIQEGLRFNIAKEAFKRPTSPWMAFPSLIIELSTFLPYDFIKTICKDYKNYKEMKISRAQFKRYIKSIAGDKLLAAILRSRNQRNIKDEPRRLVHHGNRGKYVRRAATSNQMAMSCKDLDDLRKKNLAIELI